MPLTVIAVLRAHEDRQDDLLAAVKEAATDFHTDAGCRLYAPHRSGRDRVVLVESYDDRTALDAHAASDRFAALRETMTELLAGPPEVLFCTPEPSGYPAKGGL